MSHRSKMNLVLALGADPECDEGIGLIAAGELERDFGDVAEVVESEGPAGLHLLELMQDYERALLLDSVRSGHGPAGTIWEYSADDICHEVEPSPHYEGLCEVLTMARRFEIPFPAEVRVLAMEIGPPDAAERGLSAPVEAAMAGYLGRAACILEAWRRARTLQGNIL